MADVLIVGAGVVGASVAYQAARRGASVTLIDRSRAGSGVTGDSFGWIGDASGDWPGGAEDLRGAVLTDYRRLETEVSGIDVRWTGSLQWTDDTKELPRRAAHPAEQRLIGSREVAELEPQLRTLPTQALYTATDGGVDPAGVAAALVQAAREHGAEVLLDTAVGSLRTEGGRVVGVDSSAGPQRGATVVLAAGTDVAALTAPLGSELPVTGSPALLIRLAAPPGLVKTVVATPDLEVREVRDGQLLMTAPASGHPSGKELRQAAAEALRRLAATFRAGDQAELVGVRVGRRPMPADGGPIIGYLSPTRDAYVAVLHSAVTLAPTVGRLIADEILDGVAPDELRRCRPARFRA